MHDDDTKAILARRARFVAMALAGVGTATQATACVCLQPLFDANVPDVNDDARVVPADVGSDAHDEDASALDANVDASAVVPDDADTDDGGEDAP
jgi:hypothetical protein